MIALGITGLVIIGGDGSLTGAGWSPKEFLHYQPVNQPNLEFRHLSKGVAVTSGRIGIGEQDHGSPAERVSISQYWYSSSILLSMAPTYICSSWPGGQYR